MWLNRLTSILLCLIVISCGKELEDTKPNSENNNETPSVREESVDLFSKENKERLYLAIKSDDKSIVKSAVNTMPHLDFLFETGESPLSLAISEARSEIILLIINKVKNFNLLDLKGTSPLVAAIKKNNLLIVKLLIAKEADLNIEDKNKITPLYHALYRANEDIALELIVNGADLIDQGPFTIEELATDMRLKKVTELIPLIKNIRVLNDGQLIRAVRSGNANFVEYLLKNYAEFNDVIKQRNVLSSAINIDDEKSRLTMMETLLKLGADPNNKEGVPALIHATEKSQQKSVELLLQYADPFIEDATGSNALHYAVEQNNFILAQKIYLNMKQKVITGHSNDDLDNVVARACIRRPAWRNLRYLTNGYSNYRGISNMLNCY